MRNGAFGCSNVIVCYCCPWVGLANTSARGMKQSLSCCGFACCHRTQEMRLFTLKLFDGARRMLPKKSFCRHYFPHGNSGLGIWVTKYWSQVLRPHTQDLFQIILLSGQGLRGSAYVLGSVLYSCQDQHPKLFLQKRGDVCKSHTLSSYPR